MEGDKVSRDTMKSNEVGKSDVKKNKNVEIFKSDVIKKRERDPCSTPTSSSHSKFFRRPKYEKDFKQITRDQYNNISETISSSETYNCIHGPEGKVYTKEGLLKRNILKELDPIVIPLEFTENCPITRNWEIASKLAYLIQDKVAMEQLDRVQSELRDLTIISSEGYRVDYLDSVIVIIEFLLNSLKEIPANKATLLLLLKNMKKPILMTSVTDIVKYYDSISYFIGYMGYLLMKIQDEHIMFDLVSKAISWQLTAPDSIRGSASVRLFHMVTAASILIEPAIKMLAIAPPNSFPVFLEIVLLLAFHTKDNCIEMMKYNIIEIIFYRFNPFFPNEDLPWHQINPADCQDMNLKLGVEYSLGARSQRQLAVIITADFEISNGWLSLRRVVDTDFLMADFTTSASSIHISTIMSLLLVLLKTTIQLLKTNPQYRALLPYPDYESIRCFIWAYRYECRAREHNHERITLTIIAAALLKIFGSKMQAFSNLLMPDIMSLSVFTELPQRNDWIGTVNINTRQQDVFFKKILIYFVVDLLKTFPCNKFMVKSRYWLLGMMYLLDADLSPLRAHWSSAHFGEIRKIALQALVCTLPLCDYSLVQEYCLIRRILWYIEWYLHSPYEIQVLYWCVRFLQVVIGCRNSVYREISLNDLFDTHGIIILIRICDTLLEQKEPPVERSQAVLSVCLRMLTSAAHRERQHYVSCCVYPSIIWPCAIFNTATHMLQIVLLSLDKHYLVSDKWLVALLNFIWEGVVWNTGYRKMFVDTNGVFKLLDIITMTRPPVQCIALAIICDIMRAGEAVGQVVTWRANFGATNASPVLVKHGATIATLLAAIFRETCQLSAIALDENGILEDLDHPIMTHAMRKALNNRDLCYTRSHRTAASLSAAEMAGSRMSKTFAILHMLSEDLKRKVSIADEAYNLYKNIKLKATDETVLVLCSHYLTLKLNEVWMANHVEGVGLVKEDMDIVKEFLHIGTGWAKEIKRLQEDIMARDQDEKLKEERTLYEFLARVQLNTALDALKEISCITRSSDRVRINVDLLLEAVAAYQRIIFYAEKINLPILRTYRPALDNYNIVGQQVNMKTMNLLDKEAVPADYMSATAVTRASEGFCAIM